jgi:hypothetical protein
MIRIGLILITFTIEVLFGSLLGDDDRYIYQDYNDNLKIIWLNNKSDYKREKYQKMFAKALNHVIISLKKQNKFDNITSKQKKQYSAIVSVIEDSSIYIDKTKLLDAVDDLFDDKLSSQLVVALKFQRVNDGHYKIFGLKMFKDGKKSIATTYEVHKHTNNLTQKTLENMIRFFILSSISDYDKINRGGVNPIITFANNTKDNLKLKVFKAIDVKVETSYIQSQDFQLAYKLHLISSDDYNPKVANEYCAMTGQMLINKKLIPLKQQLDEYNYEQLFEQVDFKDGWIVYGKNSNISQYGKRDFRCIEAKDTLQELTLQEYEINEIGLQAKLNNKTVAHQDEIKAVDIIDETNIDGEYSFYVAMADITGTISVWQNQDFISKKSSIYKQPRNIKIEDDFNKVVIDTIDKTITYTNNGGALEYDSSKPSTKYINQNGEYMIDSLYAGVYKTSINIDSTLHIGKKTIQLSYTPTALGTDDTSIFVGSKDKIYQYNTYGTLKQTYTGITDDVTKIVFFNHNKNFVASTNNSELIFYEINKPTPIKIISNFGYSFLNMAVSQNQKFLAASNADQMVYVFDLEAILNSTISNKVK